MMGAVILLLDIVARAWALLFLILVAGITVQGVRDWWQQRKQQVRSRRAVADVRYVDDLVQRWSR